MWSFPGTSVYPFNNADRHDILESGVKQLNYTSIDDSFIVIKVYSSYLHFVLKWR